MPCRPFGCSPETTIATCCQQGWAVVPVCDPGKHSAYWGPVRLAEDFAPEVTLGEIAERLKCKVCGSTEGTLSTRQDRAATSAANVAQFEAREAERDRKLRR